MGKSKAANVLKFTIPADLVACLRAEALCAHLSLSAYLITIINARPVRKLTRADSTFRRDCVEVRRAGGTQEAIQASYAHLPHDERAMRDAILQEVIDEETTE